MLRRLFFYCFLLVVVMMLFSSARSRVVSAHSWMIPRKPLL